MSIKTDIASLEILAQVYRNDHLKQTLHNIVHTLPEHVNYIDWVGIYMFEGDDVRLEAATDLNNTLHWESNSELNIPISHSADKLGQLVVKSKQPICFDITDVSTLHKLAAEIANRMRVN